MRTVKSANFPTSIDPFVVSSKFAYARVVGVSADCDFQSLFAQQGTSRLRVDHRLFALFSQHTDQASGGYSAADVPGQSVPKLKIAPLA